MSGNDFWNDHGAALALNDALATIKRIETDRSRWEWSMPPHVEKERDEAAATVRAAVRYLCTDDEVTA